MHGPVQEQSLRLHWAERWIMPRSEVLNPTLQEIRGAGMCQSYLTALDHLLGTERHGPVSAFLADLA